MARILVADHRPIVRAGIHHVLAGTRDLRVGAEVSTARELLSRLKSRRWAACLLNPELPGRPGLDLIRDIRKKHPQVPLLILSDGDDESFALRAVRAGAAGFLASDGSTEQLLEALRCIVSGGTYVSPALAGRLALNARHDGDAKPHEILSNREYQVLRAMAGGKTVSQIARDLLLSVKTISTYRGRILQKMRLRTNADLIRYALKNRLVE